MNRSYNCYIFMHKKEEILLSKNIKCYILYRDNTAVAHNRSISILVKRNINMLVFLSEIIFEIQIK